MNLPWFKRTGILFVPTKLPGWAFLLGGAIYAVHTFLVIDGRSHSVSDTLINFVFRLVLIAAAYSFVAFMASRRTRT